MPTGARPQSAQARTARGYIAKSGQVLFRYPTGEPIGGGVISYMVAGRQYIAVAVGMNAPATWKLKSPPAKLVIFGVQ